MPFLGSPNAPTLDPLLNVQSVPNFFMMVDQFGTEAGIDGKAKIAWTRYYAQQHGRLWVNKPEVAGDDYQAFVRAVMNDYPGVVETVTPHDLEILLRDRSQRPFANVAEFGAFYREFRAMTDSLVSRQMIAPIQVGEKFLRAIHMSQRPHLERLLILRDPMHESGAPWDLEMLKSLME
jgi:hypothetical protein